VTFVNREIWNSIEGTEVNVLPDWSLWVMLRGSDMSSKVSNPVDLASGK